MASFDRAVGRGTRANDDGAEVAAAPGRATLVDQAERGVAGGGGRLPHADAIQASFGPAHDVSSISAHVGGAAAEATAGIGAEAYAIGDRVAFGSDPSLHTAAHEAAHVMQQRDGVQLLGGFGEDGDDHERNADAVADRVVAGKSAADLLPAGGSSRATPGGVQMRRLPTNTSSLLTDRKDPTKDGPNFAAHAAGMKRAIEQAWREMDPTDQTKAETEWLAGMTKVEFAKLPEREQLTRKVAAIEKIQPDTKLGDPKLIDIGPRKKTDDTKNLKKLVAKATEVFDQIAAGHDKDLEEVFGKGNVTAARKKYAAGKKWMNKLIKKDHVVSDRSGYSAEVGLGGLTGFHQQIALEPGIIDKPEDKESIITMIHESLHAGNSDVSDYGYIDQPSFKELAESVKLTNAAHFEVVPRRILGASHAFAGETFTPAGVGSAPALTDAETAIRNTSELFREAWTIGLNLHTLYNNAYKHPKQWRKYRKGLPYWSKVENMTIHLKTDIDRKSKDPAKQPVSQLDMALSESCTRRLVMAMSAVPATEKEADDLEKASMTKSEITKAHKTIDARTESLTKLVINQVTPITGSAERDLRAVKTLAKADWGTILDERDPATFAD